MKRQRYLRLSILMSLGVFAGACGSNPYGYARSYEPLGDEAAFHRSVRKITYEQVRSDPEGTAQETLGWFGVVTAVEPVRDEGTARITLSLRYHQPRHLCRDHSESSCRVTVSESSTGLFTALVRLEEAHRNGRDRVWVGSLLKIYGSPTGQLDDAGGPVVRARYYRHWPPNTYVTTAARQTMRR